MAMRRARSVLVVLAVAGAVTGCTADDKPPRSGGQARSSITLEPDKSSSDRASSSNPTGVVAYDETTAPPAFTNRTALMDCGVVLDIHVARPVPATPNQAADNAVRDCWRSAREDQLGAEARIVVPSIDSGPIFYYLRTLPTGGIEAWRSAKDAYMGRNAPVTWEHLACTGVEPRNLEPTGCTEP